MVSSLASGHIECLKQLFPNVKGVAVGGTRIRAKPTNKEARRVECAFHQFVARVNAVTSAHPESGENRVMRSTKLASSCYSHQCP